MPTDAAIPSAVSRAPAPPGPLLSFWRSFRENRGAVMGLTIVVFIALVAILASVLAPYDPLEQFRDSTKLPPIWAAGGDWRFPLGTDPLGRDMLSRIMYGGRISLFIGLSVMVVSISRASSLRAVSERTAEPPATGFTCGAWHTP